MKAYLAGPMRGYPEYNFPTFQAAARILRQRGYEVWSPAERDESDGLVVAGMAGTERGAVKDLRYYMQFDLPEVLKADVLVMLPGWKASEGAMLEAHVAVKCRIPVYEWADIVNLSSLQVVPLAENMQQPVLELQ